MQIVLRGKNMSVNIKCVMGGRKKELWREIKSKKAKEEHERLRRK